MTNITTMPRSSMGFSLLLLLLLQLVSLRSAASYFNFKPSAHFHAQPPLHTRFGYNVTDGLRNNNIDFAENVDGRIINGTLAKMEATRHQASIRRRLNDFYYFGTGHICGGSLIRRNVVLSAAHCFVDQYIYDGTFLPKEDFTVVMGNLDRFEYNEYTLEYDIEELVMDLPKFDLTTYDKDIALIFLNGSVPINHPTVRPIQLTQLAVPPETVCQTTGWGLTEEGFNSDVLMTVDVPIISDQECKTDSNYADGLIKPGMICAGYLEKGERDACSGDSGGPLVCQSKLAGIVSWGVRCAEPRLPGVYTEVSYYYNWVEAHIIDYGTGSGSGSGEVSGDGSGDGSGNESGDGSGDGSGNESGDGSGGVSGDGSGDGSGNESGDGNGDGSGVNSGDGSGMGSGNESGDGSGDGSGESSGNVSGDGSGDGSGNESGDSSGDVSGDGSGDINGNGSGNESGDGSGNGNENGHDSGDGNNNENGNGIGEENIGGNGSGDKDGNSKGSSLSSVFGRAFILLPLILLTWSVMIM